MSKRRIAEKPEVHAGSANVIEDLAHPHVVQRNLAAQYREATKDAVREAEAQAWSEGLEI